MRISLITLGCKLNQAETNEIKDELREQGYVVVPFNKPADVAVVRACAVTMNASQTTRELIRQAKKRGSYVIASGCLENRNLPEIDFIAETPGDIIKKITTLSAGGLPAGRAGILRSAQNDKASKCAVANRTRAMIKIQTGCNFNCAYCVIPSYRGKSSSVPAEDVIKKIRQAEKKGFKEITLTGVNICQYCDDSRLTMDCGSARPRDLAWLLKLILKQTKIERIRLGSLDPRLITTNLISVFKNPRLMPHWHLSLQSGSDSVLKRMNRGYTTKQYFAVVKKLRSKYPLFSFTTDIIVGFPGETEKEFEETLSFVKKVGFAKVHAFPYSKRPNTPAEKIPQIHDKTKTERVKRLIKISESVAKKYAAKLKGKIRPVLFEQKKNGYWLGFAPEYVLAKYRSKTNLKNQIKKIKMNLA